MGSGCTPCSVLSPAEYLDLRQAVCQLAKGICHLHQEGKIHCYIKHSNVLVTADGKVKILDYGLTRELSEQGLTQHIQGTYSFMPPEQAMPGRASPASDWYSFGVMLYQALTGRLPFLGDAQSVLFQDKQVKVPVPPETWCPRFPTTSTPCASICSAGCRITAPPEKVLEFLGLPDVDEPVGNKDAKVFVGAGTPWSSCGKRTLMSKMARPCRSSCTATRGSARVQLWDRFLGDIREDGEAVVLASRCNERVVPRYEALRGIVDALTHYLRKPSRGLSVKELLPRDLEPLLSSCSGGRTSRALGAAGTGSDDQ